MDVYTSGTGTRGMYTPPLRFVVSIPVPKGVPPLKPQEPKSRLYESKNGEALEPSGQL